MTSAYVTLYNQGVLKQRVEDASRILESCTLCPHRCSVNRLKDQRGYCKSGPDPIVYSHLAHRGEEPPISGSRGSGTIFFSRCTMRCVYCQNFEFSQAGTGTPINSRRLAEIMLELQGQGCHNINCVTPTHNVPQILQALLYAVEKGLRIPLVYNTSGYETPELIRLLDGIIDIYLPDMRYASAEAGLAYSQVRDYPSYNRQSVKLMHQQVGTAQLNAEGIMERGLIIRHLVLPNSLSGTDAIMKFIAEELGTDTYVSLMSQYTPYHKAAPFPELARRITVGEYEAAQEIMESYGIHNGWVQESFGLERFAGVHIKPSIEKEADEA